MPLWSRQLSQSKSDPCNPEIGNDDAVWHEAHPLHVGAHSCFKQNKEIIVHIQGGHNSRKMTSIFSLNYFFQKNFFKKKIHDVVVMNITWGLSRGNPNNGLFGT